MLADAKIFKILDSAPGLSLRLIDEQFCLGLMELRAVWIPQRIARHH